MNVADSIPVYLNRLHPHPITSKSTKDRWLLRAAKWIDQYLSNGPYRECVGIHMRSTDVRVICKL